MSADEYQWYIGYIKQELEKGFVIEHSHWVSEKTNTQWVHPSSEDIQIAEKEHALHCKVEGEWNLCDLQNIMEAMENAKMSFFIILVWNNIRKTGTHLILNMWPFLTLLTPTSTNEFDQKFTTLNKTDVHKQVRKYGKRIVLIFYILCISLKNIRVIIFPFIHILFSFYFAIKAIDFFICPLSRFVSKKGCLCVAGFLQLGTFFIPCICKYIFYMLEIKRMKRKTTWFLCIINSFQNQNTCEHNFNLIINDNCLLKGALFHHF